MKLGVRCCCCCYLVKEVVMVGREKMCDGREAATADSFHHSEEPRSVLLASGWMFDKAEAAKA